MVNGNIGNNADIAVNNIDRVESAAETDLKDCKVDIGLSKYD